MIQVHSVPHLARRQAAVVQALVVAKRLQLSLAVLLPLGVGKRVAGRDGEDGDALEWHSTRSSVPRLQAKASRQAEESGGVGEGRRT